MIRLHLHLQRLVSLQLYWSYLTCLVATAAECGMEKRHAVQTQRICTHGLCCHVMCAPCRIAQHISYIAGATGQGASAWSAPGAMMKRSACTIINIARLSYLLLRALGTPPFCKGGRLYVRWSGTSANLAKLSS